MVDNLDKLIIEELQQDGRAAFVDLADKLGISEGTIRKRFKKLVLNDVIKVVGVPNLSELGYGFVAVMCFQVKIDKLRKVAEQLINNYHVCYILFVTGRYDLMAIVITKSSEALSAFIEKEIFSIPGIIKTETFISLDIIKGESNLLDTINLVKNLTIRT